MNRNIETIVIGLPITCADKAAEIAIDQIRTISQQRMKPRIDQFSAEDVAQLRKLISEMYGD